VEENDQSALCRHAEFSESVAFSFFTRSFTYEAVQQPIESYTNILFSSGTSGDFHKASF
jgi:alpha-amylase/alpha-mannosidase (GH57 family)